MLVLGVARVSGTTLPLPLVGALLVKMLPHIFCQRMLEMRAPRTGSAATGFLFDGTHPALSVSIQIGRPWGSGTRVIPAASMVR